jgi:hypothetical protein
LHESAVALLVGDSIGGKGLDGNEAIQAIIAGFVDYSHAALSDGLEDRIVRDGLACF